MLAAPSFLKQPFQLWYYFSIDLFSVPFFSNETRLLLKTLYKIHEMNPLASHTLAQLSCFSFYLEHII